MRMAFNEGGPVDPVSGNPIPPGGTARGVRDDVPAMLSEGEFVIPANVAKFYGTEKLQKMVDKANEQLIEMEDGDDEPLPFTQEELQTFSEGGEVEGAGYSSPFGGFETKMYVNPDTNQTMSVMFIQGVPYPPIPSGFVEAGTEQAAPREIESDTEPTPEGMMEVDVDGHDSGDKGEGFSAPEQVPPEEWDKEDFENYLGQERLTKGMSYAMSAAGPAGAFIGAGMRQGYQATGRAARKQIDMKLNDPELPEEDRPFWEEMKSKYESEGFDSEEKTDRPFSLNNLFGDLFGQRESVTKNADGNTVISGPSPAYEKLKEDGNDSGDQPDFKPEGGVVELKDLVSQTAESMGVDLDKEDKV